MCAGKQRGYRNIEGSCFACCQVSQQKVSRMGVALFGCEVIASFHLYAKMGTVARFSQNISEDVVSCHNITPMPTSDGMLSKRVKGTSAHWDPWDTTLWQLDGPVHQDIDPAPVMVERTARRMHVVWKLKAIVLCQQWRRFPTPD